MRSLAFVGAVSSILEAHLTEINEKRLSEQKSFLVFD